MNNLMRENSSRGTIAVQEQVGQYLTFLVEKESFGINIRDVKEILEVTNITHVPLTPEYIYGVINLRGNVVPVIDLSARLKHRRTELSKFSCIVLVDVGVEEAPQLIGMLVDEVRDILEIPSANIKPAPDFGSSIRTDFIQAMGCIDDLFIILLDISRVLSLEELSQLGQLAALPDQLSAVSDFQGIVL